MAAKLAIKGDIFSINKFNFAIMENTNIKVTKSIFRNKITYLSLFVAFVVMMLAYPNDGKFKYDYHKGRPWLYETLTAPIDFPLLKTQAEMVRERDDVASKIIPYYIYDEELLGETLYSFAMLKMPFQDSVASVVDSVITSAFRTVYEKGLIADHAVSQQDSEVGDVNYIFVQRRKGTVEMSKGELYTQGKALRLIRQELMGALPTMSSDSIMAQLKVDSYLVPNLVYDAATTKIVHKEAVNYISPTKGMVYTGQLIVSEGETVTAEIEQMLDSYKAEYILSMGYSGSRWQMLLGHSIFILVILSLLYVTIYFVDAQILKQSNKFMFLLFVVVLAFVSTVLVRNVAVEYLYLIPYAVFALYMMAFFHAKMVFPIYMISLLPLLITTEYGIELYIMNIFAGGAALVAFSYLNRGWLQFMNSLQIFVGMLLIHVAFELVELGSINDISYTTLLYIFLNSLFVVAAYPLVFLLEKIFYLVSNATLKDLSDTNNALLQELARKAPGTFQHSLQVANLAERAVDAIGGNARLVKVGAMYHDVGKIGNPQCFIENQAPGINFHKDLSPMESAREIIKHVQVGEELAKKYHLPQIIREFITSHHGCSQTGYFYTKYCNEGGDPANIGEFTYKGTLPTTKEQVVVMMADAVEAASRSLKDYSVESISKLVNGILSQRMSDSQLIRADISIKEINIVKSIFIKHLGEIYHARIAYPHKKK